MNTWLWRGVLQSWSVRAGRKIHGSQSYDDICSFCIIHFESSVCWAVAIHIQKAGDIHLETCAWEWQINNTFSLLHAQNVEVFKDLPEKKDFWSLSFTELLIILIYCPICGKVFGEIFQLPTISRFKVSNGPIAYAISLTKDFKRY